MAKISLRAYNQEIGKLIDHGQTEEASAHCKYILKIFPKHLDTYRLLGKTYLESQRYSEAADILQRVLAVVPDDFVSQIGLSIIREDEGNLDAAIWNMERAFEVQPSNAAVQEELRRLYGNRDGVQPPRVRLTRGALVRMYTKGNLYQQAIAEARAAIAESPKRTDLEILLARNYYLSKNFSEATGICGRLVKKMPYCYEANLILAEILPKANKAEEAKIFAKRVQELDPYAAFTDRSAEKAAQVPDDAVTLEKLEWQPSMEEEEQPRWAKSIGVDIGSKSDQEPAADWLSDMPEGSPESSAPMPFIIPEISSDKSEENLPGWMKEDEWSTAKDSEAVGEGQKSNAFIMDDAEELQEAEVPEWLQSMAPDEIDQGQPAASPSPLEIPDSEASDAPDWLNGLDAGAPAAGDSEPISESPFVAAEPAGDEDVPEWMQDMSTDSQKEETPAESPLSELPDFSADEPDETAFAAETPAEDTPDWLKDLESTTEQSAEQAITTENEAPGDADVPATLAQESELPDWLSETGQDAIQPPAEPEPESDTAPAEDVPDWLQDLESTTDQPVEQATTAETDAPGNIDSPAMPVEESEVPDWLSEIGQEETPQPEEPEPASAAAPAEDIPDWLQDLESTDSQPIEQSKPPELEVDMPGVTDMLGKPAEEAEVPDWLSEIAPEAEAALAPAEELLADITKAQPAAEPPPGSDEVPDWLQELDSPEPVAQPENELPSAQEASPAVSSELPDWLQSDDEAPAEPQADAAPGLEAALPEAILGAAALLGDDNSQQEEQPPALDQEVETPFEKAARPAQDIPDWMSELAPEQEEPAAALVSSDDETLVLPRTAEEKAPPQASEEIPEDPDEAFAWLESLAAQQGADEEALSTPVEERDTSVPDWLQEMEEETPKAQTEPESLIVPEEAPADSEPVMAEAAADDSLPDWLQDLDKDTPEAKPELEAEVTPADVAPTPTKAAAGGNFTDWLHDLDDKAPIAEQPAIEEPEQEIPPAAEEAAVQPASSDAAHDLLDDLGEVATTISAPAELEQEMPIVPEVEESPVSETPAEEQSTESVSVPDWLNDLAEEESAQPEPAESQGVMNEADIILPDWMQSDAKPAEDLEPAAKSASIPDWLEELKPEDSQPAPAMEETTTEAASEQEAELIQPEQAEDTPRIAPDDETLVIAQRAAEESAADEVSPQGNEMPEDPDEAFAWLESLAAKHGADEDALVTATDERQETPPDWVQDLGAEEAAQQEEAQLEEVQQEEKPSQPDTLSINDLDTGVDLMNATEEISTEPNLEQEEAEAEALAQQWLQSLASGKPIEEVAAAAEDQASPEIPEQPITAEAEEHAPAQAEVEPAQEPAAAPAAPVPSDEMPSDPAEAFAWLESLAAQQGADEEALSTPVEERDSTTPDWLQEIEETSPEEQAEQESKALSEDVPAPLEEKEAVLPAEEPAAAPVAPVPSDEMPSDPAEAFAWLESLAAQQGADEEALSTPVEERDSTTPDWLQGIEETAPEEQADQQSESLSEDAPAPIEEKEAVLPAEEPAAAPVATVPSDEMPSDPAEAFAWLESLAAQQGADEEALSTPVEERDSTTPDWLQGIEETASEAQADQESEALSEDAPAPIEEKEVVLPAKEPVEAMDDLPEVESQPAADEPIQAEQEKAVSLPEWLREFEEPAEEETTTTAKPEQQVPQDETVVRWLHKMDEEDSSSPLAAAETFADELAEEAPAQKSAAQDVITEPVKTVEEPVAEEITEEPQAETEQPVVKDPVQEIPPAVEAVVETEPQPELQPEAQPEPTPEPEPDLALDAAPATLTYAQKLLSKGQIEESVAIYKTMIEEDTQLDAVIKDLNDALLHHPVDSILWLTLGDAYMQKKEMQSALSAYTKAEELLR